MENKPWPLLILAFFHVIEPLTKILFFSIYWQISPFEFVQIVIEHNSDSMVNTLGFFLFFPIAGFALFAVKKWSLFVFLVIQVWVLIINIPYLVDLYQTSQLWLLLSFIGFGLLNIAVVTYLLLPAVRIAYLDPRIRWWEAKPRYSANIPCEIDGKIQSTVRNISQSGVFITTDMDLPIDSDVNLEFILNAELTKFDIKSRAHVVHKFTVGGHEGYGARFNEFSPENKRLIKSMIKYLEKSNCQRRPPRRRFSDLIHWFVTLLTTGKGLLPKTSAHQPQ
jgi:hypothetical protein